MADEKFTGTFEIVKHAYNKIERHKYIPERQIILTNIHHAKERIAAQIKSVLESGVLENPATVIALDVKESDGRAEEIARLIFKQIWKEIYHPTPGKPNKTSQFKGKVEVHVDRT